MKKQLKVIEVISSVSALLSKILLAFDSIVGWPFSLIGYVLISIYNLLRKDTMLAVTVTGLAGMSAFGWYKWSNEIAGLFFWDYIVLGITFVFALFVYIRTSRKGGLMGHIQGLITVAVISAFLMLGYKIFVGGWIALIVSHLMLAFFYWKRSAKYYVVLQIISIIIAAIKVYGLIG
ncbi:nicotinamide mononucleotide transporter [Candidatus Nomurabacteria bacterium]|nr:nicotinamide mononucleotide transporter [Candidatus Nomurabacteria bacterium]USN94520.1 MAG: nicotinamide mononucleotide transporter [Candidatus Nomurabacteria bacterium]